MCLSPYKMSVKFRDFAKQCLLLAFNVSLLNLESFLILRRSVQQCKSILADWSLSKLAKKKQQQTNKRGRVYLGHHRVFSK